MLNSPEITPAGITFTPADRTAAVVEQTADLDKAEVLEKSTPPWLAGADLATVQALRAAFQQSGLTQARAAEVLDKLKPLDVFCKEELTRTLKEKWTGDFDVERDTLEIVRRSITSTSTPFPVDFEEKITTTSRSLLHAAMENFTAEESESDGIPRESLIRINGLAQTGLVMTPTKFALLCRELDLGARYQSHIAEVLALPAQSTGNQSATAADVQQSKLLDLKIAVHIASLKKDISEAVYTMLLSVINQDVPAAQTQNALFDGSPVIWQGLMIYEACVCGALVFSAVSIDTEPTAKCVVYMPDEPRRPLFEYASLDEFKVYLSLKLQTKSYRQYFASQLLPGHDKTDFFTAFDEDKSLGNLTATPATCLSGFFFGAFVSKTQRDAQVLAVSSADVDERQRQKTIQRLLDDGVLLLNAAAFFVPALGQLMLGAAVIEVASEVYEGVQDWTHAERHRALSHLLTVVENLAQLAAFAVGGKIVSAALSRGMKEQAAFFDGFEAVTRADGQKRLWKPDLQPYRQTSALPETLQPDAKGIYKDGEHTSIVMEKSAFRVTHNSTLKHWQISHPARPDAYAPAVERNAEGGWRYVHEHAHEWPDSGYALKRAVPRLDTFSQRQLTQMADIAGVSPAELCRLHESNLKLPARLNDCIERFKLNDHISRFINAMEAGENANTEFLQEQLHTLPRLPGWPAHRFIEVRDDQSLVVARFPETAPVNDEVNSVHVSQKQLDAGQLLDTVIAGLYPQEVEGIIGVTTGQSKAGLLASKIGAFLKDDRRALHEWLYKSYDGEPSAAVATLRALGADVPTRVAEELLAQASQRDRVFLRDRKMLGLDLVEQVRAMQSSLRVDRALTGLHLPHLANSDSDQLALRLLDQLQGWDEDFRLEVRQDSPTGTLLDSVGKADASVGECIVKTSDGYHVNHLQNTLVVTRTSRTFVEAILHALPAGQRTRMGLSGADNFDSVLLREHLVSAATGNPARATRVLRGEKTEAPAHLSACTQADPPVSNAYPWGLIRKVRKLYPLFTNAQVSAFLDAAGTTHKLRADRIKDLQAQWKKLRSVLHRWRDDEVQMKQVPGTLNDVRVSRRQVANAIESCWRRITPPRWPAGLAQTTLNLQRNPVGALPTLTEQDVAHVRTLCIRDMDAGDELAYFLKPFKGLLRLELDGNQLTRLPEALSHMPDLEHLSLNRNKLALTEHTLRKLAAMRKLKVLELSGNRLGATVDVSKMFDLRSLLMVDTHSTELPVGLSRLPYLDLVNLSGNDIRELPDWLFRVPGQFARRVVLRHNPLSEASRAKLKTYRAANGIGMGFLEDDVAVINEQKARELWMPDAREENYAGRNRSWTALKNEPHSAGFFQLLAELGSTADNRFVHEDMTRRVWSVIEAAEADSALRDHLLPLAERANCNDSTAMLFSNLETAVDIDTLIRESANAHDQAARLLDLGRRLFRQDYLATLSDEYVRTHPQSDPVEVALAYRTGLAVKLELIGQPTHMLYASLGGVTPGDLSTAYDKVIAAELSSDLLDDISSRAFWSDFLREHHAKQFTDLAAPFHERVETAIETREALGDGYLAHVDGIVSEMETAQKNLLKRLTQQAMQAAEQKVCFKLD